MAKMKRDDLKPNGNGKGHIKFRYADGDKYVDFDMEGIADSAVADGLKSIAIALAGRTPAAPGRILPKTTAPARVLEEEPESEPDTAEETTLDEDTEGPASEEVTPGEGASRPRRRAPKAPTFLSDLDLTKANVPLADFLQKKNPNGDMEKYAVIAVWFKENLSTEEITIDHIFTAYKALGWQAQLPEDPAQTFRNLKSNKNWFESGSKRGTYKINWNGISAVNKMGEPKP